METTVTVGNIILSFEDTGGIPVLFVHGFPLDHTMWQAQLTGLEVPNRLIAPDLRGFGKSSAPQSPYNCYSMDAYAWDLRNLMDALKLQQVVMVGLSMGGYITFAFHRLFPDRLKGIVLVDTRAGADTQEKRDKRMADIAKARSDGVKAIANGMLPKLFSPHTRKNNPALVGKVRDMMARQPLEGVAGALQAMAYRPDSTPGLPSISVPTLVVVGADDELTPVRDAMEMAENIPNSRLVTIPKAGHLAPMERPDRFNRALRGFLAELR
jgi:pimeloyl-ACP methyl ester carboxylesterase